MAYLAYPASLYDRCRFKYNSRGELLAKHILKVCNRHIAYNLKPLWLFRLDSYDFLWNDVMEMTTKDELQQVISQCREMFVEKTQDYGASWRIMRPKSINWPNLYQGKSDSNLGGNRRESCRRRHNSWVYRHR